MKIAVVQLRSIAGEVEVNIDNHKTWIQRAVDSGSSLIIFPELSLTGYEPKLAKDLSTHLDDRRFEEFQKISNTNNIVIALGMPIKDQTGILIGMPIFEPNKPRKLYAKQILHSDELPYFKSGHEEVFLKFGSVTIAPAICYESLLDAHAEKAFKNGATIYIASVAKSALGIEKANQHLLEIASKYSMTVLMSNCVGPCDDFIGAGKSAVWNERGRLLTQLNDKDEGILIFNTETQKTDEI